MLNVTSVDVNLLWGKDITIEHHIISDAQIILSSSLI